jgi:hypothetical protein
MPAALVQALLIGGYAVLLVCLPLVPAIAIYTLFPKTKIAVRGPFKGLRLNVGGAFGAYLIVAMGCYPIIDRGAKSVLAEPMWTLDIPIQLVDENGKALQRSEELFLDNHIQVLLTPQPNRFAGHRLFISVPLERQRWEHLTVLLKDYGRGELYLKELKGREDPWNRVIRMEQPLRIERITARPRYEDGGGYANAP